MKRGLLVVVVFALFGLVPRGPTYSSVLAATTMSPTPTATRSLTEWARTSPPDAQAMSQVVGDYARSMGLAAERVKTATFLFKGKDGNFCAVVDVASKTPFFISTRGNAGEWEWRPATLRNVSERSKIEVGISVDGSENYVSYKSVIVDNFNLMMPDGSFAANTLKRYGDGMAVNFTNWASEHSLRLRILSALHVDYTNGVEIKTKEQADRFMRTRLETLMSPKFIKRGSRTELVVVHEATVQDWGDGKEHWLGEGADRGLIRNPLLDVYGKEWPVRAYQLAYQIADERGLRVGEDVVFAFSDYDFLQNRAKAKMVTNLMVRIRQGVVNDAQTRYAGDDAQNRQNRTGIRNVSSAESVRITLVDETHMHADKANARGWAGLYTGNIKPDVIRATVKELSSFGDVEMSEVDVSGTTDMKEKALALSKITEACIQSGCKSVDFYQALRFDPRKPENLSLFNRDFSKTPVYWKVMQTILSSLPTQP